MAIELRIDGSFKMDIFNFHTNELISGDFEQGILDNLEQGEYVISINDKFIYDINDLENPLYKFDLDVSFESEYEFSEVNY